MRSWILISLIFVVFGVSGIAEVPPAGSKPADDWCPIIVFANGHFLQHKDGRPFFWLGDTAWNLFQRLNREETERYLENRRLEGCDIDTGDDAISLKSGRGMNGARIGKPTEDVLITRCVLGGGCFACIGIGSETSGGIRNVRIEKTRFTHSRTHAIYIKTRTGRAGVIENISGEDLVVANGGFLCINTASGGNQSTPDDTVEGDIGYPVVRNIRFSNVRVKDVTTLAEVIKVPPEKPILGLSLLNITGTCQKGMSLANIRDAVLRGIHVTGFAGPLLAIDNTTGSGLKGAVPLKK